MDHVELRPRSLCVGKHCVQDRRWQLVKVFRAPTPATPLTVDATIRRYVAVALDHVWCAQSLDCTYSISDDSIVTPQVLDVSDFLLGRRSGLRAPKGYGAIDVLGDLLYNNVHAVIHVGGYVVATATADGEKAVAVFRTPNAISTTRLTVTGTKLDLPDAPKFTRVYVDQRVYDVISPIRRSDYIMASDEGGRVFIYGVPIAVANTLFSYNIPGPQYPEQAQPNLRNVLPVYVYMSPPLLETVVRRCYKVERVGDCVRLVRTCPPYIDTVNPDNYHPLIPLNVYRTVAKVVGFMPTAISKECVPGGVAVVDKYGFIPEYAPRPVAVRATEERPPHPSLDDLVALLRGAKPSYAPLECALGLKKCQRRPTLEEATKAVCVTSLGHRCNEVAVVLFMAPFFGVAVPPPTAPLQVPESWVPIALRMSQLTGVHYSRFSKPWPMYCIRGDTAVPIPYETFVRYSVGDVVATAYNIKFRGLCDKVTYVAINMIDGRPSLQVEVAE